MVKKFVVTKEDAGKRTDVFVAERFPEFARSALRGLFEKEMVFVNGVQEEPGDKLRQGDVVSVDVSPLKQQPEKVDLPVIYEDEDVVVINKPAGILTHSKGALNLEPTVASFLAEKITDKKLTGNRAGIVHRLDRATSGVIIGAKNSGSLKYLQKQFSQRKTKKTYVAVVEGTPAPAEAVIEAPIMRNPARPQTFKVGREGKNAQTHYKILSGSDSHSLVELRPLTGRTHQLRVHMAYINHPIIGDKIYGHEGENLLLHAKSLGLTLPNGTQKVFTAPLPKYFNKYK